MKKLVLIKPWKLKAVRQRLDCHTAYHPHTTTTTTQFVAACGPRAEAMPRIEAVGFHQQVSVAGPSCFAPCKHGPRA